MTTPNLGMALPGPTDVVDPAIFLDPALTLADARFPGKGVLLDTEYSSTTPAAPATGVKMFARKKARTLPGVIGPLGLDVTLQPNMWANKVAFYVPSGNSSSSETTVGMAAGVVAGTKTTRNVATTSMATLTRRMGYVSASTAASPAGWAQGVAQYAPHSTANLGGLFFVCRFIISTASANTTKRVFVGMATDTSNLAGTATPITKTNIVGFNVQAGESNFRFISGGSAAPTGAGIVDLGANFPSNTVSADLYEARLFVPPGSLVWNYSLERVNTGQLATGDNSALASTAKPVSGTLMSPQVWISNGGALVAEGIDIVSIYLETDN